MKTSACVVLIFWFALTTNGLKTNQLQKKQKKGKDNDILRSAFEEDIKKVITESLQFSRCSFEFHEIIFELFAKTILTEYEPQKAQKMLEGIVQNHFKHRHELGKSTKYSIMKAIKEVTARYISLTSKVGQANKRNMTDDEKHKRESKGNVSYAPRPKPPPYPLELCAGYPDLCKLWEIPGNIKGRKPYQYDAQLLVEERRGFSSTGYSVCQLFPGLCFGYGKLTGEKNKSKGYESRLKNETKVPPSDPSYPPQLQKICAKCPDLCKFSELPGYLRQSKGNANNSPVEKKEQSPYPYAICAEYPALCRLKKEIDQYHKRSKHSLDRSFIKKRGESIHTHYFCALFPESCNWELKLGGQEDSSKQKKNENRSYVKPDEKISTYLACIIFPKLCYKDGRRTGQKDNSKENANNSPVEKREQSPYPYAICAEYPALCRLKKEIHQYHKKSKYRARSLVKRKRAFMFRHHMCRLHPEFCNLDNEITWQEEFDKE